MAFKSSNFSRCYQYFALFGLHVHNICTSVSALTLALMLENGYDTDAWCGLYRL